MPRVPKKKAPKAPAKNGPSTPLPQSPPATSPTDQVPVPVLLATPPTSNPSSQTSTPAGKKSSGDTGTPLQRAFCEIFLIHHEKNTLTLPKLAVLFNRLFDKVCQGPQMSKAVAARFTDWQGHLQQREVNQLSEANKQLPRAIRVGATTFVNVGLRDTLASLATGQHTNALQIVRSAAETAGKSEELQGRMTVLYDKTHGASAPNTEQPASCKRPLIPYPPQSVCGANMRDGHQVFSVFYLVGPNVTIQECSLSGSEVTLSILRNCKFQGELQNGKYRFSYCVPPDHAIDHTRLPEAALDGAMLLVHVPLISLAAPKQAILSTEATAFDYNVVLPPEAAPTVAPVVLHTPEGEGEGEQDPANQADESDEEGEGAVHGQLDDLGFMSMSSFSVQVQKP